MDMSSKRKRKQITWDTIYQITSCKLFQIETLQPKKYSKWINELLLLLLFLLKNVGDARLGESDLHPISKRPQLHNTVL